LRDAPIARAANLADSCVINIRVGRIELMVIEKVEELSAELH
jgi:hypothetical protein